MLGEASAHDGRGRRLPIDVDGRAGIRYDTHPSIHPYATHVADAEVVLATALLAGPLVGARDVLRGRGEEGEGEGACLG